MAARQTQAEHIAGLRERSRAQDIEIRDLKLALRESEQNHAAQVAALAGEVKDLTKQLQPLVMMAPKLSELLDAASETKGQRALAVWLLGGGVVVTFAAVLAGIFKWFANGGAGG